MADSVQGNSSADPSRTAENVETLLATVGSLFCFLGGALLAYKLSTSWVDGALACGLSGQPSHRDTRFDSIFWVGLSGVLSGLLFCLVAQAMGNTERRASFDQPIARLGFALVATGLITFVGLGGLASRGLLEQVLSLKDGADEEARSSVVWVARFALMPLFAILGTLFFVAGSAQQKRALTEGHTEVYNSAKFWSGLWYRMGEAILFSLVIFLFYRADLFKPAEADENVPQFIMVLGLVMAMFVKPAERLVNGLASRLFQAVLVLTDQRLDEIESGLVVDPLRSVVERLNSSTESIRLQAIRELGLQGKRFYREVVMQLASFIRNQPTEGASRAIAPDVELALMTLLAMKPPEGQAPVRLSLAGAQLAGVSVPRTLSFEGCGLENVCLNDARLQGVSFRDANLAGATLQNAQLSGADFHGANLEGIDDAGAVGANYEGALNKSRAADAPEDSK